MLYDRSDRSTGTAHVTYEDDRDAADAVREFDNQMANGQAIRISIMPMGPAAPPAPRGSLFDRIEPAPRSLFDRIDPPSRRDDGGRRRQRSDSPRKAGRLAPDVDRYVPGGRRGGSRSPVRRRGTPREGGRRPGAKREEGAGGAGGRGGRKPRTDEEGRPLVGGRPRKTAEELDAEMNDYWGGANNGDGDAAPAAGNGDAPAAENGGAGDIDMDI